MGVGSWGISLRAPALLRGNGWRYKPSASYNGIQNNRSHMVQIGKNYVRNEDPNGEVFRVSAVMGDRVAFDGGGGYCSVSTLLERFTEVTPFLAQQSQTNSPAAVSGNGPIDPEAFFASSATALATTVKSGGSGISTPTAPLVEGESSEIVRYQASDIPKQPPIRVSGSSNPAINQMAQGPDQFTFPTLEEASHAPQLHPHIKAQQESRERPEVGLFKRMKLTEPTVLQISMQVLMPEREAAKATNNAFEGMTLVDYLTEKFVQQATENGIREQVRQQVEAYIYSKAKRKTAAKKKAGKAVAAKPKRKVAAPRKQATAFEPVAKEVSAFMAPEALPPVVKTNAMGERVDENGFIIEDEA